MRPIGIGIIGSGKIALANHLPGVALREDARVVALCDADPGTIERAARSSGVTRAFTDHRELLRQDDVDAVIVATPNHTHEAIVIDAARSGKHVLCEKPLALDLAAARRMLDAVQRAGVKHMTAFTYRFVPAMRYMKHLVRRGDVGTPLHFRAQRFQDWGDRPLGWRQVRELAGTGEMGDMLSHRIDYAHLLVGPIRRLVADLRTFVPVRGGQPSDVDDWVALIAGFDGDATGVLESTKLAAGRGEGYRGQDVVELNGTDGSIVYSTQRPHELRLGRRGDEDLHAVEVPAEFRVWPGSRRDPTRGDPLVSFRYDQAVEFIDAIANDRPCVPGFLEGVRAQAVMEAAVTSQQQRRWVEVET